MEVTTRLANQEDLEFARGVHHEAYREWVVEQFGPWNEELQNRIFAESWGRLAHEVIVADGQDCGYAAVEVAADAVHLREFAISAEFRGRGIGASFLRQVNDRARAAGLPFRLRAFKANRRAIALYERAGFVHTGATEDQLIFEWSG